MQNRHAFDHVAADRVYSQCRFYPERNLDLKMANQVTFATALAAPPSPARGQPSQPVPLRRCP
jgi:hypothetical protein